MPTGDGFDVDVAIVGGGCAGLSLAARLAVAGGPSCVVLEARTQFEDDRIWCFWDSGQSAAWGLVPDAAWDAWSLRLGGADLIHRSARHRYTCIRARSFHAAQCARIARAGRVRVRMGCRVAGIDPDGAVTLADGSSLRARLVFDARPPTTAPGAFVQHFEGWEIETATAAFDPQRAVLMDFDVAQDCGIHFLYVLPFSPHHALVEATVLSTGPWPEAWYRRALRDYLRSRHGLDDDGFTIRRRERGVLPMEPVARHPVAGVMPLGILSGAAKPSSGYAFPFIQTQADAWAERLLRNGPVPPDRQRNPILDWMDRTFVRVLKAEPGLAPSIFAGMFRATSGEQFARFMMEEASPGDLLAVVRGMPPLPFVRAALRGAR